MITKVAVTLTPKFDSQPPQVSVSVPGQVIQQTLERNQRIELEFDALVGWLEITFMNKPDNDATMAVIIDSVDFFGISDPRFAWNGIYTPHYPEPWYSQQIEQPPARLPQQTYMGWNGVWRLEFDVPVFTWMHGVMNLGWLYQ